MHRTSSGASLYAGVVPAIADAAPGQMSSRLHPR